MPIEDDGTRVVNAFRKSGNQWFYLDEDGHLLKNCEREIDGKVYVFNERGAVVPSAAKSQAGAKKAQILIFPPSAAGSSI